jgi:hypothetical protein
MFFFLSTPSPSPHRIDAAAGQIQSLAGSTTRQQAGRPQEKQEALTEDAGFLLRVFLRGRGNTLLPFPTQA